tara:strand:- start:4000 stop:4599 length:600 start_codon:yes stop_codon:yes gene_type:complete
MNTLIYDFETLSKDPANGAVVSLAMLNYDEKRISADVPYTYAELLGMCTYFKFDVIEQVKSYNRVIQQDTLAWWQAQIAKSPELQAQLDPSDDDVSIAEIPTLVNDNVNLTKLETTYTRGNTFDPPFMDSLCAASDQATPYPWYTVRDTRSMIDGMSWGIELNNRFIPEGLEKQFVAHDPRHDIVMDVMRMQTLAQALR